MRNEREGTENLVSVSDAPATKSETGRSRIPDSRAETLQ